MTTAPEEPEVRTIGTVTVARLPALLRGRLHHPAWPRVGEVREALASPGGTVGPTTHGSLLLPRRVMHRATLEPTGEVQVLVVPAVEAGDLVEPDPRAAVRELMDLTLDDVCDFVSSVGERLAAVAPQRAPGTLLDAAASPVADRLHHANRAAVAGRVDPHLMRRMVEVELGAELACALDGWVDVDSTSGRGVTARMGALDEALRPRPSDVGRPRLRGLPTTQLHITAGNSPAVPTTSLLWAWASKGACVLKPAAPMVALAADLSRAVAAVGDHPLGRHTTIAYWPGGESRVEEALLGAGRFDRTVVWGSDTAIRSVMAHNPGTDAILLRPRQALSLIAGDSAEGLLDSARRAATDSVVADQRACMSSLVHVVEGDPDAADRYAEELGEVLAQWDTRLPHWPTDDVMAELHNLRRGLLATARWRVNGGWPRPRSAVVRLDRDFDLARHPGGRVVIVRAVPQVRAALPQVVASDVSHVGVGADLLTDGLRDDLAALGVDNILPLGEAEQVSAGRPHDGMRVLTRLVRWVNG